MTDKKKTPYERVANAMHGVDDTLRDMLVYPSRHEVLGISEGEDFLVLSHASNHDDGGHPQMVWVNTDNVDALVALSDTVGRLLIRARARERAKKAVDS